MFAKCVSRTFVALVLAAVLAVLPAAGLLAAPVAPTAPADGAPTWYANLQDRLVVWTDAVLEALRFTPRGERPVDDPVVTVAPQPDGETLRYLQGEEGYKLDPDG